MIATRNCQDLINIQDSLFFSPLMGIEIFSVKADESTTSKSGSCHLSLMISLPAVNNKTSCCLFVCLFVLL